MSIPSEATHEEEEEEEEPQQEGNPEPSHHPTAPSDELFDISTTVDPGYIISLIRQLLPPDSRNCNKFPVVNACDASTQGSEGEGREESAVLVSQNGLLNDHISEIEAMDTVELTGHDGGDDGSLEKQGGTVGKDAWEECGCILWDLAASKTHAEFMVQNLVLEVLLANLMVPQSVRVTEITLGIIGNLACHEVSRKHISSTNGLIEVIVDQLFLDDAPCLCEAYRVLTLGLQGCGCIAWAKALEPERMLSRVLWVAENTLNPQLIEKSVGLLLAILESEQEVVASLLPKLMQLGLPGLLVNLLTIEMSKLAGERVPERYCILDLILRTIEALSVIDDYSQEISSSAELFRLLIDLVKFPDKIEKDAILEWKIEGTSTPNEAEVHVPWNMVTEGRVMLAGQKLISRGTCSSKIVVKFSINQFIRIGAKSRPFNRGQNLMSLNLNITSIQHGTLMHLIPQDFGEDV